MSNYKQDPHIRAYLEQIRISNKQRMSVCYKCGSSSIGIIAEGYSIYPACLAHSSDENGKPYWEGFDTPSEV